MRPLAYIYDKGGKPFRDFDEVQAFLETVKERQQAYIDGYNGDNERLLADTCQQIRELTMEDYVQWMGENPITGDTPTREYVSSFILTEYGFVMKHIGEECSEALFSVIFQKVMEWFPVQENEKSATAYLSVISARPLNLLSAISFHNKVGTEPGTGKHILEYDGYKFKFDQDITKIDINAHKLLTWAIYKYMQKSHDNTRVVFSLKEFAWMIRPVGERKPKGEEEKRPYKSYNIGDPTPSGSKTNPALTKGDIHMGNARKEINYCLKTLRELEIVGKQGRNQANIRPITETRIEHEYIHVVFNPVFAEQVLDRKKPLMLHYPTCLFGIPKANPNAYRVGDKLGMQWSMDNNRRSNPKTHDILSIDSILNVMDIEAKTLDELKQKNRRDWRDKILEPLENALNWLENHNMITWRYSKRLHEELTDAEMRQVYDDYYFFSELYIVFAFNEDIPDYEERMERKTAKIEKAKEKAKARAEREKARSHKKKKEK